MKMNEKTININSNLTVKLNTTDSSYIMYVYKMLNELYDYGTFDYDMNVTTMDDNTICLSITIHINDSDFETVIDIYKSLDNIFSDDPDNFTL